MNLMKRPILYADILNSLSLGAKILYEDEDALCILDEHSGIYYCAANNPVHANMMVQQLPASFELLVSHDVFCNEAIQKRCNRTYDSRCYHCAYLSKTLLDYQVPDGYTLRLLVEDDLDQAIRLYEKEMPELANKEYMGESVTYGMLGIFEGATLCGFIGVHEGGYGSIGMLEVDEVYRRKGFASILEKAMINHQIKQNRIPYGEIFDDNLISIKLQQGLGMNLSEDLTYWYTS